MVEQVRWLINILIALLLLQGCSSAPYRAPVTDVSQPPPRKIHTHVVAPGETLYSIAWRYDLDYKSLAAANGVASGYTIYPGQIINLNISNTTPPPKVLKKNPPAVVKKKVPAVVSTPPRSGNTSSTVKKPPEVTTTNWSGRWQWPCKCDVIASFHSNGGLHKGIDLKGDLGDSVLAAGAGQVVYAGDGLRGYGKLLIVKHSDKYLSAYAHNSRLLVKEGDVVAAGQKIAEMGSTGTDSVKLHFEVRYDGQPVNPLNYLPKK